MPELKTRAAWRVGLLGALGLVAASCATALEDTVLTESFKGPEPLANWVLSKSTKYAGQPITVKVTNITGYPGEQTLLLEKANHHYGIATPFKVAVDNTDKPFVVQYEVKMDEILTCGGAYIKLFEESAAAKLEEFDNNTPYIIMFGPDKCGGTNKVHFILRHKNPVTGEWQEKHAKGVPPVKIDRKSNLYTLIVRPDNSFEILVNNVREKKGSLLEDMDPPVNPPEYIDDPSDKKPEDWVDEAKIADPEARKPDDWDEDAPLTIPDMDAVKPAGWLDDEPELVADPEATEPEDWEEEEDGVWEAPLISNPKCEEAPGCGEWVRPTKANPAYKGKWSAPLIDNPEYKGEWKPRQIRNPGFFTDDHPHNLPKMGALAVEIWTTNAGLRFDNFYVGYSEEAAAQFAEETWKPKYEAEKAAEDAAKKEAKNKERTTKKLEGGWRNLAEVYAQDAMEYFVEKPIAAVATAVALILSFVLLLWRPKRATEPAASAKSTDDEPNTQGAEDSGVEEKKSSAPGKGEDDENEEEEEEEEEDDKADDDN